MKKQSGLSLVKKFRSCVLSATCLLAIRRWNWSRAIAFCLFFLLHVLPSLSLLTAIAGIFSFGPQIIPITTRLGSFDGERLCRACSVISPKAVPPISIEKLNFRINLISAPGAMDSRNPYSHSQHSEAPATPEDTPAERRERKKWTPADDEVLISALLNTSKDALVGIDHKSGTFWQRVGDYYASSPRVRAGGEKCNKMGGPTCKGVGSLDTTEN
ncbi:unnamed protein product [Brassica rapa]|uniref:Myb-like domain-containing protein n=1 Tax=Brassica campestris TaxID=3711 RepID=A0A8D9GR82_BRACM|nr:unnamed protein product [Brassica rapa]